MYFENAREMSKKHPETFYAPSSQELSKLKEGHFVKVCVNSERFWCEIVEVDQESESIKASVANELIYSDIAVGEELSFKFENIYDIYQS